MIKDIGYVRGCGNDDLIQRGRRTRPTGRMNNFVTSSVVGRRRRACVRRALLAQIKAALRRSETCYGTRDRTSPVRSSRIPTSPNKTERLQDELTRWRERLACVFVFAPRPTYLQPKTVK